MKNHGIILSCVFFVSFFMFHVLPVYSAEQSLNSSSKSFSKQSSVSIKADSQRLKSNIRSISKSLKLKQNQRSKLQKKIYQFDSQIQKLGDSHLELSQKQTQAKARLAGLAQEKSFLLKNIKSSNQAMAELIRAFYLIQNQQPLKALINGENSSKTARLKIYHDYLIKDYLKQYQVLSEQYETLKTLDVRLNKRLSVLEELEEQNRKQALTLRNRYKQRGLALNKLEAEITSATSKVTRLKADQKRLEKLAREINRIKKAKPSGMSFATHKGGLSWPVKGHVTQTFGRLRAGSKLKWRGVLIRTQAGASVTSVANGRIVFADWLSGYGFVIIVDHGRGYMSLYAHNQQLLGNVGDSVRENQLIALAGSSGRNGKPALYFEIRYKGKPVNPAKWIAAKKSHK